jgi:enterochelin esterase-like enzyme
MELLPWLESRYVLHASPQFRTIAGYSLGGLSAVDIAWNHPRIFGKVGAFSASFWWRRYTFWERIFGLDAGRLMHLQVRRSRKLPELLFWFQAGTMDESTDRNNNGIIDSIDDTLDLMLALSKKGYRPYYDFVYHQVEGGEHNQETWKKAMPHFLRWAFGRW